VVVAAKEKRVVSEPISKVKTPIIAFYISTYIQLHNNLFNNEHRVQ